MTKVEAEVYEVGKTEKGSVILLQGKRTLNNKILPILCNPMQGRSIKKGLTQATSTRPQTHDLFLEILNEVGGALDEVVIDDIEDGIYYAKIHISVYDNENQKEITLDARPSDSIAIATRERAPIYVEEKLLKEKGVPPSSFEGESQKS
ncbi:MAG: Bifunctional nuclease with DNase and RNase activity [Candidatus Methanohalarchaeum thermophilum]|uniref:Bifunctional nuclease with DNase and RNase activity n=1 Tax=Methanohalarchaeum thermophilum TaxID=1903181 RepID=A0A1Q6DU57_METT1|nr:MAG: Bifunctional nuclease with DNase and RNase activity [Candidatus Methanohalarchaeum thermophilum]